MPFFNPKPALDGLRARAYQLHMDGGDYLPKLWANPWRAVEKPLPEGLDETALNYLHDTVYAIIQALGGTLEEGLPFIGRLVEVNRRLKAATGHKHS